MKKLLSIVFALALLVGTVSMASAQLGDTDVSSFAVQNLGTGQATVDVTFYNEAGTSFHPNELDCNAHVANPLVLDPMEGFEVVLGGVCEIVDGRYSVVIESTEPVAVTANLNGASANFSFNGSYSGFAAGGPKVYMPSIFYNYYGWYSLVSVQNTTPDPVNIDVKYYQGTTHVATHSATNVPGFTAVHFDWETNPATPETGQTLPGPNEAPLSAVVEATGDVVAVDNQTIPAAGNTQSYNGFLTGATTVYAPALYSDYYGWFSSILIQNIGDAPTTVTVTFNDGCQQYLDSDDWTVKTTPFTLNPKQAKQLVFQPTSTTCHPSNQLFGAKVTSSDADVAAIVNQSSWQGPAVYPHAVPVQAQAHNGFATPAMEWGLPNIFQKYYDWDTSFTFQNISTTDSTVVTITYSENLNPWGTAYAGCTFTYDLGAGDSKEYYQPDHHATAPGPGCDVLPDTYRGSVTLVSASQPIVAMANETNEFEKGNTGGDWSMSYNGFNK